MPAQTGPQPEIQRVGDPVLPNHQEPVQSGAAPGDVYGVKPAQAGRLGLASARLQHRQRPLEAPSGDDRRAVDNETILGLEPPLNG